MRKKIAKHILTFFKKLHVSNDFFNMYLKCSFQMIKFRRPINKIPSDDKDCLVEVN